MSYQELLLGCGHRRQRLLDPYPHYAREMHRLHSAARAVNEAERWKNVVTVDLNPACNPDIVMDLSHLWATDAGGIRRRPVPDVLELIELNTEPIWGFRADAFDEVHAYEVLEHLGSQGDYEAFFSDFDEIWHMLKPGGFLCATCPSRYSVWLWGDPGHRRAIYSSHLAFLHRPHYDRALGTSPSSDYRTVFKGDFDIVLSSDNHETHSFILQAVKPPREAGAGEELAT